jgi:hypothetical protein
LKTKVSNDAFDKLNFPKIERYCAACGDPATCVGHLKNERRYLCTECFNELECGVVPPMQYVTSGKSQAKIVNGHQPGIGDGNDFFGNHT